MARDPPQLGAGGQGQSVRTGRRPPRSGALAAGVKLRQRVVMSASPMPPMHRWIAVARATSLVAFATGAPLCPIWAARADRFGTCLLTASLVEGRGVDGPRDRDRGVAIVPPRTPAGRKEASGSRCATAGVRALLDRPTTDCELISGLVSAMGRRSAVDRLGVPGCGCAAQTRTVSSGACWRLCQPRSPAGHAGARSRVRGGRSRGALGASALGWAGRVDSRVGTCEGRGDCGECDPCGCDCFRGSGARGRGLSATGAGSCWGAGRCGVGGWGGAGRGGGAGWCSGGRVERALVGRCVAGGRVCAFAGPVARSGFGHAWSQRARVLG